MCPQNISLARTMNWMIQPTWKNFMFLLCPLIHLKHYLRKCWFKCWTLITWLFISKTCQRRANNCFSLQEISTFGKLINHNKKMQHRKFMVKFFNSREVQVHDLRSSNSQTFRIVISCMLFSSSTNSIMVLCKS
jgi:hypothetical protein